MRSVHCNRNPTSTRIFRRRSARCRPRGTDADPGSTAVRGDHLAGIRQRSHRAGAGAGPSGPGCGGGGTRAGASISMPAGSEAWVADGMRRIPPGGRECPFCAQDMTASPVLTHYRAFFSEEYRALKESIGRLARGIDETHSDNGPIAFERALRIASERRAFWARFADMPEIAFNSPAVSEDWRRARQLIATALAAKAATPLDRMELSPEVRAAVAAYDVHRTRAARIERRAARRESGH